LWRPIGSKPNVVQYGSSCGFDSIFDHNTTLQHLYKILPPTWFFQLHPANLMDNRSEHGAGHFLDLSEPIRDGEQELSDLGIPIQCKRFDHPHHPLMPAWRLLFSIPSNFLEPILQSRFSSMPPSRIKTIHISSLVVGREHTLHLLPDMQALVAPRQL
jgi:hypothetical protein